MCVEDWSEPHCSPMNVCDLAEKGNAKNKSRPQKNNVTNESVMNGAARSVVVESNKGEQMMCECNFGDIYMR